MPVLEMKDICKSFFGTYANRDVCLEVREGEIHALLGENGAGKTTLMNILYGMYQKDAGSITIDGQEIVFKSPKDAIARHIGMVHQHFTLVPTLTVQQNITLGLRDSGYPFSRERARCEHIDRLSDSYGLKTHSRTLVKKLSVGEMQRVEILKLLYRKAKILILDEPTAVLTPQESDHLFAMFKQLKAEGCSIIVITHHIQEVLDHCDRVTVLRDGCSISTVETKEIDAKQLSKMMIGRELVPVARERQNHYMDAPVLELVDFGFTRNGGKVGSVNLSLKQSEILGIAGVDGNGQKELLETLMGLRHHEKGKMLCCQQDISNASTAERRLAGIGYISDDRHRDSLVLDMGIAENLLLRPAQSTAATQGHMVNKQCMLEQATRVVKEFSIKSHGLQEPMRFLSGGNQQKLVLAREFIGSPKVIIAFQPTRGLDIGATEFVHNQLLAMRSAGCATLLVSTNLEEILLLSDRIAVIHKGSIMDTIENKTVDITRIGLLMAGVKTEGAAR